MARHRNVAQVAPRKILDTTDFPIGQPETVTMPITGDPELVREAIQPVDGPDWQSKAELLAFMEEPVTIRLETSHDKNAAIVVQTWNDGRPQNFIRGKEQTVKRKFVEVLARAKVQSFGNVELKDADGNNTVAWPKSTSQAYPFQVIRDDNPKGRDWLKKILAEG